MRSLTLFFNILAAVATVFFSLKVSANPLAEKAVQLNYVSDFATMQQVVEKVFPTKEDAKWITKDFASLKEYSSKWMWRFEPVDDKLAFRVNGQVQFFVKLIENEPGAIELNGSKIVLDGKMSYKEFQGQVKSALGTQHAFKLDRLFFEEAHAQRLMPLLYAGAAMSGAANMTDANLRNPAAVYQNRKICIFPQSESFNMVLKISPAYSNRANHDLVFNRGPKPTKMPVTANSKIVLVAKNFQEVCQGRYGCRNFASVGECAAWKQRPVRQGGWNLSGPAAFHLCQAAWNGLRCNASTYTPPPVYNPPVVNPTPCHRDKLGNYSGNCAPNPTPCHRDKLGNYSGNCAPTNPTPTYRNKGYQPPVTPTPTYQNKGYKTCPNNNCGPMPDEVTPNVAN